jgi:hypothetical protein
MTGTQSRGVPGQLGQWAAGQLGLAARGHRQSIWAQTTNHGASNFVAFVCMRGLSVLKAINPKIGGGHWWSNLSQPLGAAPAIRLNTKGPSLRGCLSQVWLSPALGKMGPAHGAQGEQEMLHLVFLVHTPGVEQGRANQGNWGNLLALWRLRSGMRARCGLIDLLASLFGPGISVGLRSTVPSVDNLSQGLTIDFAQPSILRALVPAPSNVCFGFVCCHFRFWWPTDSAALSATNLKTL